jgi:hypothetical protein
MRLESLPVTDDRQLWRDLGYTKEWAKRLRGETLRLAATNLFQACRRSHDPAVREAFTAYDVIRQVLSELEGDNDERRSGNDEDED